MAVTNLVVKKRLVFSLLVIWLGFIIITGRLAWIQLVRGEELQRMAADQWVQEIPVEPKRGTIYDRNGKPLAISASVHTIVAYPPEIKDPAEIARKLSEVLDMNYETVYKKLTQRKASVYIKRKVEDEVANAVRKLEIKGVGFAEESKRYYPDRNLLSHVLGFTGIDSQGLDGIEFYYDKYLRGFPGRIVSETDALSREIPFGSQQYIPPRNGYDLVLSIDKVIQHFAERELEKALVKHKAKRGSVIVMDPQTGEILALVNKPDYDPNNYAEYSPKIWRNAAVSDVYEPGSTFKIITAVAALEEGVVKPNDRFYDSGYVIVSGERIRCWKQGGHGSQTFVNVVENSCNVGFVNVAQKLGKESFVKYIKGFGFGKQTGIDLPGEAKGIFAPEKIGPVELATISFGQGISTTPLQMVRAISAIANGGKLVKPMIAKGLKDEEGRVIHKFMPRYTKQVISQKTADEMKQILASVVANGTGSRAQIKGYSVAGKTGTAEKYAPGKYVASFIGFAPVDNPRIAMIVVIDEPQGIYYGGQVAAPVFQKIMKDALLHLKVKPQEEHNELPEKIMVPKVEGLNIQDATTILIKNNLKFDIKGEGIIVEKQYPPHGSEVPAGAKVILTLKNHVISKDFVILPDLKGKSIREASQILHFMDLQLEIEGEGFAIKQEPLPGTRVKKGSIIKVYFEPIKTE